MLRSGQGLLKGRQRVVVLGVTMEEHCLPSTVSVPPVDSHIPDDSHDSQLPRVLERVYVHNVCMHICGEGCVCGCLCLIILLSNMSLVTVASSSNIYSKNVKRLKWNKISWR